MQRRSRLLSLLAQTSVILLPALVPACALDEGPDAMAPPDIPRGQPLPPLAYSFALSFDAEPGLVPRPETIEGHLYLEVHDDGQVVGAMSTDSGAQARIVAPTGRVDGSEVVLLAGSVDVVPGGSLEWDEVRFSLADADGDGTLDSATGSMRGTWTQVVGDIYESVSCTAALTAGPDTLATQAYIQFPPTRDGAFLPHDAVEIQFGEPLRDTEVLAQLAVTADDAPVEGTIEVTPTYGGLVRSATFHPNGFLPFDARISLVQGSLADPSGNPVTVAPDQPRVVADPGDVLDNLGFESALDGWIALGDDAQASGAFQGIAPVEGEAHAVLNDVTTLAAYMDVPEDASTLDFSVAVLSQFTDGYAARVTLHDADGGSLVAFDASELRASAVACDTCDPFRYRLDPVRPSIDLTPYRGQRVMLTVDTRATFFIGIERVAMILDDLRLQ